MPRDITRKIPMAGLILEILSNYNQTNGQSIMEKCR